MTDVAPVIHIGGWPGAGKQTIARTVADRLGARLIHNHLMLDAAGAIYDRGALGWAELRAEVRAVIMGHAETLPPHVPVILTDALADEPASEPLFQPTINLARTRGASLICFILELSVAENERRLTDPARGGGAKLMDLEVLRGLRQSERLYRPAGAVELDVTHMSAIQAADAICAYLEANHG